MINFHSKLFKVSILAMVSCLVVLFQNCSSVKHDSGKRRGIQNSPGNGNPYEGKILISEELCPDQSPAVKIKVTGTETGELLKDNCSILSPAISIGAPDLDLTNLTYKGKRLVIEDTVTNAIQLKQHSTTWNTTSAVSFTSDALAIPTSSGALIICTVLYVAPNASAETLSVTDNLGNTYRRAVGPLGGNRSNGIGGATTEVWYAENSVAGSGLRATFNFSQTMQPNQSIRCYEYSGVALENSLDQVQSNFGTSAAPNFSLGPVATNWNNELVFLAYWGPQAPTVPSGFSPIENLPQDGAMNLFTTSMQDLFISFQNEPQLTAVLLTFRSSK